MGVYWIAVLTAFMTAFYTGRAFFLTFFGPEKLPSPDDPQAQNEAAPPRTMTTATITVTPRPTTSATSRRPS